MVNDNEALAAKFSVQLLKTLDAQDALGIDTSYMRSRIAAIGAVEAVNEYLSIDPLEYEARSATA